MICISCNVDVPPSFKLAIASGRCPACGEDIMDETGKTLMGELSSVLEQMQNDPQGLAGWLLSNYRMQKIGSAEPTVFYGKPQPRQSGPVGPQPEGTKYISSQWAERAGVNKIQKGPASELNRLQGILRDINGEAGTDIEVLDPEEQIRGEEEALVRKAQEIALQSGRRQISTKDLMLAQSEPLMALPGYQHQQVLQPIGDMDINEANLAAAIVTEGFSHIKDPLENSTDPSVQRARMAKLAAQAGLNGTQRSTSRIG